MAVTRHGGGVEVDGPSRSARTVHGLPHSSISSRGRMPEFSGYSTKPLSPQDWVISCRLRRASGQCTKISILMPCCSDMFLVWPAAVDLRAGGAVEHGDSMAAPDMCGAVFGIWATMRQQRPGTRMPARASGRQAPGQPCGESASKR